MINIRLNLNLSGELIKRGKSIEQQRSILLIFLNHNNYQSIWELFDQIAKGVFVWAYSGFPQKKAGRSNQTLCGGCGLRRSQRAKQANWRKHLGGCFPGLPAERAKRFFTRHSV
jgi:hypothetical protein